MNQPKDSATRHADVAKVTPGDWKALAERARRYASHFLSCRGPDCTCGLANLYADFDRLTAAHREESAAQATKDETWYGAQSPAQEVPVGPIPSREPYDAVGTMVAPLPTSIGPAGDHRDATIAELHRALDAKTAECQKAQDELAALKANERDGAATESRNEGAQAREYLVNTVYHEGEGYLRACVRTEKNKNSLCTVHVREVLPQPLKSPDPVTSVSDAEVQAAAAAISKRRFGSDVAWPEDIENARAALEAANHQRSHGRAEDDDALGNLLAVIHGDGGHYQSEHGTLKAIADAEARVIHLVATAEREAVDAVTDEMVRAALTEFELMTGDRLPVSDADGEDERIMRCILSTALEAANRQRAHGRAEEIDELHECEYENGDGVCWKCNELARRAKAERNGGRPDPRIAFFDKYALGSKLAPSCFGCGQPWKAWEGTTRHAELPDIYLCAECARKINAGQRGEPVATEEITATHDEEKKRCVACWRGNTRVVNYACPFCCGSGYEP